MNRLLVCVLSCSVLLGCELIADFDRSKIEDDSVAPDASVGDAGDPASDAGADSGTADEDAGVDGEDAG